FGDKLPADTKSQLQAAIDDIKAKKDNGTKEEIKAAMDKLQGMISSMAQAAGANQAQPGPQPGASEQPKNDKKGDGPEVVDAEVVD
ncbi:MAG: molecular chaperone DnaK, partial [Fibrobacter sp.]|nr:molecular chaperone DnaK [Fibrobacter sp.]